jgi:hypothetical protein
MKILILFFVLILFIISGFSLTKQKNLSDLISKSYKNILIKSKKRLSTLNPDRELDYLVASEMLELETKISHLNQKELQRNQSSIKQLKSYFNKYVNHELTSQELISLLGQLAKPIKHS